MNDPRQTVSIHPYFKVKPGKMAEAKAILARFLGKVASEPGNLFYDFTLNGDVVFCREAYIGAKGVLAHLENVGPILAEFLKVADLFRLELHGAPEELEKLKGPFADLKPEWYVFECGVKR